MHPLQQLLPKQHLIDIVVSCGDLDQCSEDLSHLLHDFRLYVSAVDSRLAKLFFNFSHYLG